jgi:hypothetical protein
MLIPSRFQTIVTVCERLLYAVAYARCKPPVVEAYFLFVTAILQDIHVPTAIANWTSGCHLVSSLTFWDKRNNSFGVCSELMDEVPREQK